MKIEALALVGLLAALAGPVMGQDGFPVTLTHAYGETVIGARPERIATIGWITQDAVLALGHVPVGLPRQDWGGDENGLLPWVTEAILALGAGIPTTYDDTALPFETILMLQPDVILAPYSALTEEEYRRLSAIAPTVAWSGAPWTGSWQEVTRIVGRALGQEAEATALIEETGAYLQSVAGENPGFESRSFTFGWGDPSAGSFGVYLEADPRIRMIEELGLDLADGVRALEGEGFYLNLSLEEVASVAADILIIWQSDQAELDAMLANPVFARFAPVASGCVVAMVDRSFVMATSAPSVLSIPWSVDRLVPELARVIEENTCG